MYKLFLIFLHLFWTYFLYTIHYTSWNKSSDSGCIENWRLKCLYNLMYKDRQWSTLWICIFWKMENLKWVTIQIRIQNTKIYLVVKNFIWKLSVVCSLYCHCLQYTQGWNIEWEVVDFWRERAVEKFQIDGEWNEIKM